MLHIFKNVLFVLVALVALSACGSMDAYRDNYPDPDERLNHLLALYNDALTQQSSCFEIKRPASAITDCARLQIEIERLHYDFPWHQRTMMALGVLYYSNARLDRAQLLLDQLLAQSGEYPEAAVLRSRIALEEGNLALATSVLRRQLTQSPGHPDLLSAMASVYYTGGNIAAARNMLDSPTSGPGMPWMTAYHRGLIAESSQDWAGACMNYQHSLQIKPGYTPAISRVIALAEHVFCGMPPAELVERSIVPTAAAESVPGRVPGETLPVSAPGQNLTENWLQQEPVDNSPVSVAETIAHDGEVSTLSKILVDRMNGNHVLVDFLVSGKITGATVMKLENPHRMIIQMPATRSNLVSGSNYFSDSLVSSVRVSERSDTVSALISLSSEAEARILTETGRVRLLLTPEAAR